MFFVLEDDNLGDPDGHTGAMPLTLEPQQYAAAAHSAATRAAQIAHVRLNDESNLGRLGDIEKLLISVWGASPQRSPIPADVLRSISHAGCNVSAAYDRAGVLCGAAVAIVSPGGRSMYSLIAGVRPGLADAGVGFALKQHQRAWGLQRGLNTMTWTFDPLVSRNARFNLTKLGAHAAEYAPNFYGQMDDQINADDESDRLVATWPLAGERAIACSTGNPPTVELPRFDPDAVRSLGPDGMPNLVDVDGTLWCRVPRDIIELRSTDTSQAKSWRTSVRTILMDVFAGNRSADGVTRDCWYRLTPDNQINPRGE